jgi:hypothetical protein
MMFSLVQIIFVPIPDVPVFVNNIVWPYHIPKINIPQIAVKNKALSAPHC